MVTRDRRDTTLATLGRLLALPEQPPITVVDNGSHDGKVDAIRAAWPTVDVVALTSNLGAAARTIGVQRSRSPVCGVQRRRFMVGAGGARAGR